MKQRIGGIIVILIFGLFVYRGCFVVTDKFGLADKYGRQIFIQSIQANFISFTVASDFSDQNTIERLWLESKRTTIKFICIDSICNWDSYIVNDFLSMPIDSLFTHDKREFNMTKTRIITLGELKQIAHKKKIFQLKEFLEAMCFDKIIFINLNGDKQEIKLHPNCSSII